MAGMDAPECKTKNLLLVFTVVSYQSSAYYYYLNKGRHFDRLAQPYYIESLAWLKDSPEGRRVKYELLRRDQYERIVALPLLHTPSGPGPTVVGGGRRKAAAGVATHNLPSR